MTEGTKFTLILNEDERAMLEALAEADSRSAASWVRATIKAQHAARFGARAASPKKGVRRPKR